MRYSDILLNVSNIFENDPISTFLESFTFIPNNFGHQWNNPDACCDDRIIGDFELIYVLGGESRITVEDRQYRCKPGDMVLIPPFIKHKIQTTPENPHNNYWFHFDVLPYYRHDDLLTAVLGDGGNVIPLGQPEEIVQLYQLMEKELWERTPGYRSLFTCSIARLITALIRAKGSNLSLPVHKYERDLPEKAIVDKSIEYIYENLSNTIKVADLCKYLHISESYLFKCFLKVQKLPPNRFIQLVKIKRAEQLIKTTALSFKEIAEMLGFSSQYYFSSAFKKYYRISPKEYANLNEPVQAANHLQSQHCRQNIF